MLDIKFIKENADLIKGAAKKKHLDFDLDELLAADENRLKTLSLVESFRAEQNGMNDKVASASSSERGKLISEMKILKERLRQKEDELKEVTRNWQLLMLRVPNIPDMSVPDGASDADNVEVRVWGKPPKFSFEPRSQTDLLEKNNWVDFERGAKTAGFRGYFLKNEAVKLNFALFNFALDFFSKRGFSPMMAPILVRREVFVGTGYLPQGEDDLYKTQDGDFLAGTAEVPIMGYHMDEVIDLKDLPIRYLGFSPCYRREAGSHGKDTKGLIRVHEFFKFEQVILCEASHEESVKLHEEITRNSEELMQALGLPHRVVVNCGGDLGLGQVKKYDIEAWVPSENKYRETHSSSYFHDFQTRRLNIRYRDKDGKLRFAHSLNNTAMATPRLLASIIENYQREDGSIGVPEALKPYLDASELKGN